MALAINPNDATMLGNKGRALDDLGNHTQTIQYYDKALATNPNDATILSYKKAAIEALSNTNTIYHIKPSASNAATTNTTTALHHLITSFLPTRRHMQTTS